MLGEVRLQAVERHHKTNDVEGIPDEDTLTVEGDNSGATAQDHDERIIFHAHLKVWDQIVWDEGSFLRKHVVGGSGVGHGKAFRQKHTNGGMGDPLN